MPPAMIGRSLRSRSVGALAIVLGATWGACSSTPAEEPSNGSGSGTGAATGTGGSGTGTGTGGTGTGAGAGGSGGEEPTKKPSVSVPPLFIGSGGFGFAVGSAFPGASAPQGLAKVGPDTSGPWGTISFLHYSGYWYFDDTIRAFSHLHLHGTGATDYGVLGIMPTDAFDASRTTAEGHSSSFDKKTESATPGRYSVTLDRGAIRVDIAATTHAAHHRFGYPAAKSAHVVIDLDHHLESGTVSDAEIVLVPAEQRLRGRLHSMGGMSKGFGGYDVFFEARTKSAWTDAQVWSNGTPPAAGTQASGTGVGVALAFDVTKGAPVELLVGLSLVSPEGAAANLEAEIPTFEFDATAARTAKAWDALLGTVRVEGGGQDDRDMATAALYHAFLMPTIQSDTDGAYRAMDGQVRTADGFRYVSDLSLWDTYRTLHPLYGLIAPDRALDAVRSLHEKAKAGGFFPKWPIATGESGTMIGASADVVVADAWVKGIQGFDVEGAYSILRAAALDPVAPAGGRGGRDGSEAYMKLGYMPAPRGGSVSLTTEYANDDLALAELAAGLGHDADAAAFRARGRGWRKLFDPATGLLWPKDESGNWSSPHTDPTFFSEDYVEANAWQSAWMVAADADGLVELYGSKEALVARLDEMFEQTKAELAELDPADTLRTGAMRPYYWGGNEPDIHAPYLFAQVGGRPDLTQKWVAWSRANLFGSGPDGLPGNDDGGTMSAWWLFSALGFSPIAGTDRYVIGTPLFPHAEIAVAGGTFTVDAKEVSPKNVYVQSVTLNGAPLAAPSLRHADLVAGGSLEFVMGPSPSAWGR